MRERAVGGTDGEKEGERERRRETEWELAVVKTESERE